MAKKLAKFLTKFALSDERKWHFGGKILRSLVMNFEFFTSV